MVDRPVAASNKIIISPEFDAIPFKVTYNVLSLQPFWLVLSSPPKGGDAKKNENPSRVSQYTCGTGEMRSIYYGDVNPRCALYLPIIKGLIISITSPHFSGGREGT